MELMGPGGEGPSRFPPVFSSHGHLLSHLIPIEASIVKIGLWKGPELPQGYDNVPTLPTRVVLDS